MTVPLSRSFWIRALITAGVLSLILWKVDGREALRAIARLDLRVLLLVGALLVVDRALMVWRWIALLRAAGQPISTKSATWIYLVSSFVGGFLPAGVGADLARAYTLTQRTSQGGAAIASVAADRLLGLISILLVGLFGAVSWQRGADGNTVLMSGAVLGVFASIAFLWADSWVRAVMPHALRERRNGLALSTLIVLSGIVANVPGAILYLRQKKA